MAKRGREGIGGQRPREGGRANSLLGDGGAYPRRAICRVKALSGRIPPRLLVRVIARFVRVMGRHFNSRIRVLG